MGETLAGHAGDGRLAGRVDVGQDKHVGLIERATEFVPKMLSTREAMRLEKHQQPTELAAAGGVECRADFRRVMPVIVDNRDVVHDALDVETAANAGEFCKALANQVGGNVEIEGYTSGGSGIAYVVHPGGVVPDGLTRPPITNVGSRCAAARSEATIEVVVVLPWAPATAMPYFKRINSASISARGITGIFLLCASMTSGLSGFTAEEVTTTWAPSAFDAW